MKKACDTKHKVNIFSPKDFNLFKESDNHRDHDLEKSFRQVLDIEYYLRNNITKNNLLLFEKIDNNQGLDLLGYTFQFDFGHTDEKRFKRIGYFPGRVLKMADANFISLANFLENKTGEFKFSIFNLFGLYSIDKFMFSVSIFALYCIYKKFYKIELKCKCDHINMISGKKYPFCCKKCKTKYKSNFIFDIVAAIDACHKKISPEKITIFNEKISRNTNIDMCNIYRDAKCCMIYSGEMFGKCYRNQLLIQKRAERKIIIVHNEIDVFLKMPLDNPDIGFVSWDYPYIKIDRLNWDICEDRHVLYLLKGNDQTAYETSLEVKNALKKIEIKSFGYVNLLRTPKAKDKSSELLTTFLSRQLISLKDDIDNKTDKKEKLLGPYLQAGSVTVFYGEHAVHAVGKTIFALTLAQAMLQGVRAFKGWRETKKQSLGYYFFDIKNKEQANSRDYFSKLNTIAENIFRFKLKKKYKYNPLKITQLRDLSLTNIAKNLWGTGALDKRKFIILDDVFQIQNSLYEQIMFLQELKSAGWCIIIITNSISSIKDMAGIDNAIELISMKPSATWKTKLKVEIKSSTIVAPQKRKKIICEFELHSKRPTCNQVSKRKKITKNERKEIITFIEKIADSVKNLSNEEQAKAKKITSDRVIAENLKITISLVRKLRREIGWGKNKHRVVKIDHEQHIIR